MDVKGVEGGCHLNAVAYTFLGVKILESEKKVSHKGPKLGRRFRMLPPIRQPFTADSRAALGRGFPTDLFPTL